MPELCEVIRGIVVLEGSNPLVLMKDLVVRVGALGRTRFQLLGETRTDQNGGFSFDLARLSKVEGGAPHYEIQVYKGDERQSCHGDTRWRRGVDPGPLTICVEPHPTCAGIGDQLPIGYPGNYNVFGRVRHADGTPLGSVNVDVRQVTPTAESTLTTVTTSSDGWYGAVVSMPVGLVIRVFEPTTNRLLGSSRVQYQPQLPARIDVRVCDDKYRRATEYARITGALTPLLGSLTAATLDTHAIAALSGSSGWDVERILLWTLAARIADASGTIALSMEPVYGLLRMGFPRNLERFLARPRVTVGPALKRAANLNIIASSWALDSAIAIVVDKLAGCLKERMKGTRADRLGEILRTSGELEEPQIITFVNTYVDWTGTEDAFWASVPTLTGFDTTSAAEAKRLVTLGILGLSFAPIVEAILTELGTGEASLTAAFTSTQWDTVTSSSVLTVLPAGLPGELEEDQREALAAMLAEHAALMFPTESARAGLIAGIGTGHPLEDLPTFLTANDTFDIARSRADDTAFTGDDDARKAASIAQRLYRISPTDKRSDTIMALSMAGYTSAHSVVKKGRARFIESEGATLGVDVAEEVFCKAAALHAITTTFLVQAHPYNLKTKLGFVPNVDVDTADVPDWETLFGNADVCACVHCRSVLSPAAYFVDLLQWLSAREGTGGDTLYTSLIARRPDLVKIQLSCENTERALPYIDLVLEALESAVVNGSEIEEDAAHDTEAATADMLAAPQYRNDDAYGEGYLKDFQRAVGLPFNRDLMEMRVFLAHLGVSRPDLLRAFETANALTATDLAMEQLGLYTERLQTITTGTGTGTEIAFWPVTSLSDLESVATLRRAGEVSWPQILDLFHARYVNPETYVEVAGEWTIERRLGFTAEDWCDIESIEVIQVDGGAAPLEADWTLLRQFLRLCRVTGWSPLTLDKVLEALVVNDLSTGTEAWLTSLAAIHRLNELTGLDPVDLATIRAAKMDTWEDRAGKEDPVPSLYDRVFLASSLFVEADEERAAFELAGERDELETPTGDIADHAATVAGALGLTEDELDVLLDTMSDTTFTLANLTRLYAWTVVCRALALRPVDAVGLSTLSGIDPFGMTFELAELVDLVELARELAAAGWTVDELRYILAHDDRADRVAPADAFVQTALGKLRDALRATYTSLGEDVTEASVRDAATRLLAEQLGLDRDALDGVRALDWGDLLDLDDDLDFTFAEDVTVTASVAVSFTAPAGATCTLPASTDVYVDQETLPTTLTAATAVALQAQTSGTTTALLVAQGTDWVRDATGTATLDTYTTVSVQQGTMPATTVFLAADGHTYTLVNPTLVSYDQEMAFTLTAPASGTIAWASELPSTDLVLRFLRTDFLGDETLELDQPYDDITEAYGYGDDIEVFHALYKLALILKRLDVDEDERAYWYTHAADWVVAEANGVVGTAAANFTFQELRDLIRLFAQRARIPGSDPTFVELLESIGTDFTAQLAERTDWSVDDLDDLVAQTGADPSTVDGLETLLDRVEIVRRVGAAATSTAAWAVSPDSVTASLSTEVVAAARARAGSDAAWSSVARPVRDVLRKAQRDALVSYLLAAAVLDGDTEIEDADDLYERYLIDVSMNPEMLTSRIKQACATIQLFIHRLMLGLEKRTATEVLFEPDATDREEWEWRRTYRVWEAARKVFLYPENWIEPELRDDKTPFFKALETELAQGDITDDRVEQALLDYLDRLREVSHLEVLASYWQLESITNADDIDILHVFARTRSEPPTYWYRRFEDSSTWTPWEKVECGVEGSHLLPVVYGRRLLLFWATFSEVQEEDSSSSYWEIRMQWSEYRDGKWAGARLCEDAKLDLWYGNLFNHDASVYMLTSTVDEDYVLHVKVTYREDRVTGDFNLGWEIAEFLLDPCTFQLTLADLSGEEYRRKAAVSSFWRQPGYNTEDDPDDDQTWWATSLTVYDADAGTDLEMTEGATVSELLLLGDAEAMTMVVPGQIAGDFVSQTPFFVQTAERAWFVRRRSYDYEGATDVGGLQNLAKGTHVVVQGETATSDETLNTYVSYLSPARYDDSRGKESLAFTDKVLVAYTDPAALASVAGDYEFSVFYHPHVCAFTRAVRRGGVAALLDPDEDGPEKELRRQQDVGDFDFETELAPDPDNVAQPYPVEDIDFSYSGAYSVYNWELFFHVPLYVAQRLSESGREDDAMAYFHAMFDPRVPASDVPTGYDDTARWWKVAPLMEAVSSPVTDWIAFTGADDDTTALQSFNAQVEAWLDEPFNPHLLARLRPGTYQKVVVMRYIENLLSWGDRLFTRDTLETLNEATQLYVFAKQILGDRPEELEPHEEVATMSYEELDAAGTFDSFGNVILENAYTAEVESSGTGSASSTVTSSVGLTTYFCIPQNAKLLSYWDTVEDRLFKIRNGMNIEGVVRSLPLFEPPIDPALLVRAAAAGLDIGTVLDQLQSPLPLYRFQVMHARALALAGSVKALGAALLSALEKRDAEALALLRSDHEISLLKAVGEVRRLQVQEAERNLVAMKAAKVVTRQRLTYYTKLIEKGWSGYEIAAAASSAVAGGLELLAGIFQTIGGGMGAMPDVTVGMPAVAVSTIGGAQLGRTFTGLANAFNIGAGAARNTASFLTVVAGYQRRAQEWKQQKTLAEKELTQLASQIAAAELRVEIAKKELKNHGLQVEHSEEVNDWMTRKFTSQELYQWMVSQLSTLHFQTWQLAVASARKAERCYQHELGRTDSFVQPVHWDSLRKGLLAGERLAGDLERMELAYLDHDVRELELIKHVSLRRLDPVALARLAETGECWIELPEALFDLDCPGHYFRRLVSVDLTLSCVSGPQSQINAQLTLHSSRVRKVANLAIDPEEDPQTWPSIVTSTGQADGGLYVNERSEGRYLPFERKGAVSSWHLRLCNPDWPQIDLSSLSDVVMRLRYTARDGGESFRSSVLSGLSTSLAALAGGYTDRGLNATTAKLVVALSARRDDPDAWYTAQTLGEEATQALTLEVGSDRLPYFAAARSVTLSRIHVLVDGLAASTEATAAVPDTTTTGDLDFATWPATGSSLVYAVCDAPHSNWPSNVTITLTTAETYWANVADCILVLEYTVS